MKKRIENLKLLFFFLFLIILLFCFYLQVIRGKYFKIRQEKNRIHLIPTYAPRGMIFDRNKKPLAINNPSFSISIMRKDLKEKELKESISLISSLVNKEISLKKSLHPFEPLEIINNLSKDEALKIASRAFDIEGLMVEAIPTRNYLDGTITAHLLGYIGPITKKEFKEKRGYFINDRVGKTGIEKEYENILKEKKGGFILERDVSGRTIKVLGKEEAIPGCNLYLTIDKNLQEIGEKAFYKKNGTIIAMCPKTGEILALLNKPSFNPNLFFNPSKEDIQRLIFNKSFPLVNRAIQFYYPPGSLFKIVDAYIALEENIINKDEYIECKGRFKVGNKNFFCFKKNSHGNVNLISALSKSCNVYFYQLSLKIGKKRLLEGAKLFNFSDKTGIDLPYEIRGKIPSKKQWFVGDTLNLSIGQGEILLNPLQIAVFMSAIANSGNIFKPYIVKYIEYPNNKKIIKKPVLKKKIKMSLKTKRILDKALEEVVNSGTGRAAYIPGIRIAGKTGTAQNPFGKDHAWFACYAPVSDPKIVVVVLVEHGGQGGIEAAPIAKEIIEEFFKNEPKNNY